MMENKKVIDLMDHPKMILKLALEAGCDLDGDIIDVNGKTYYVHYKNEEVEEVNR